VTFLRIISSASLLPNAASTMRELDHEVPDVHRLRDDQAEVEAAAASG
jgi:hypothetical protein